MDAQQPTKYRILVDGIETQGLEYPASEIDTPKYRLVFASRRHAARFQSFSGVIFFQGTFEHFELVNRHYGRSYLRHECDADQLDKRTKELASLLNAEGFACVLLHEAFIDYDDGRYFKASDLSKRLLNGYELRRRNFGNRVTGIRCHLNEFSNFFGIYAAAFTYLQPKHGDRLAKVIGSAGSAPVAVVYSGKVFFIPTLLPESTNERTSEFFTKLADALVSAWEKLGEELPAWADDFCFNEEVSVLARQSTLTEELERISSELERFRRFKKVLALQKEPLVEAVRYALEEGLGLVTDCQESFREDLSIIDVQGKTIAFVEVKGTNRGVQREHINQADSHRERAGLPSGFPSILIINTNLKHAASLFDKDQAVPMEQVEHAARNNVLIVRTLDLLHLVGMVVDGKMDRGQVRQLLTQSRGWLHVTGDAYETVEGQPGTDA